MIRKLILTSIAFIFAIATFVSAPAIAVDNSYQDAVAQYEQQDRQSGQQKQYDRQEQRTQEDQSYQKQSQSSQSGQQQQQPNQSEQK